LNPTTVFLGAGAVIEIGGPKTEFLTDAIRRKYQSWRGANVDFINQIASQLDLFYGEPCNFEEIFHTLELLTSYTRAWQQRTAKEFSPYLAPFVEPKLKEYFSDDSVYLNSEAKDDIIRIVAEHVNGYDCQMSATNVQWYNDFWKQISHQGHTDFATLNYDTTLEQAVPSLNDGFEDTQEGFLRFNPKEFFLSQTPKILH